MTSHPAPLIPRCGHCQGTASLSRCSRCKVQHYCSNEHQKSDFALHKSACSGVQKTFRRMETEEEKLRNHPGDFMTPADPFTNAVGRFWGILDTRDYMRARYAHIEQLARIKTYDAVTAQLDHVMDCLRLCRSDNMGVRDMAPHLMLRLDKDQEAYDMVKWYQTTGREGSYDWGDMNRGFLDVRNADCFEGVSYLCGEWVDLSQTVAVVLVKVKMILDLISLQESVDRKGVPANVPGEILNDIRNHSVRSPVIKANRQIMESEDQKDRINELVRQVKTLYKAVDKANKHFWPTLLDPGMELGAMPEYYSRGDVSEVQHILKFTYDAWMETAGAIEVDVIILVGTFDVTSNRTIVVQPPDVDPDVLLVSRDDNKQYIPTTEKAETATRDRNKLYDGFLIGLFMLIAVILAIIVFLVIKTVNIRRRNSIPFPGWKTILSQGKWPAEMTDPRRKLRVEHIRIRIRQRDFPIETTSKRTQWFRGHQSAPADMATATLATEPVSHSIPTPELIPESVSAPESASKSQPKFRQTAEIQFVPRPGVVELYGSFSRASQAGSLTKLPVITTTIRPDKK